MNLYTIIGACAVVAGSFFYGQHVGTTNADLRHTKATIARKDADMAAVLDNQQQVMDAIKDWQSANQRNEKAYEELNQTVIGMRSTISGLRIDTKRFTTEATQDQLRAYATACTAVFHTMAAEIGILGEEGARIARSADQHAADAKLILQNKE
jgi:hypothetical protein